MKNSLLLLPALLVLACQPASKKNAPPEADSPAAEALRPFPYALDAPTARYDLPAELRELSGLTYYRGTQLACVQDERGDVFLFDYAKGRVSERLLFGPNGDYEDLVFVKGAFYILRSDGQIFIIKPGKDTYSENEMLGNGTRNLNTLALGLPEGTDAEGLGYDAKTDRLLIALKETKDDGKKRFVYFYDFAKKVAWQGLVLSPKKWESETGLTGKAIEFRPSGVAVHPLSREMYLLASDGKKLLRLDRQGIIRSVARLDPEQFRQPESICFAPDGTLFIGSEGKKKGYILRFDLVK